MSEVVDFDLPRRRRAPAAGGAQSKPPVEFFTRAELDRILQLYSRKVMTGEWLDYALGWDERGARFAIYGRVSAYPLFVVLKRSRQARRERRFETSGGGRVLATARSLEAALEPLQRARPSLVAHR
jgi:hypothetical protein